MTHATPTATHTRVQARVHAGTRKQPTWGVVDALLALVMLPFGAWMLVIDGMVALISRLNNRTPSPHGEGI